MGRKFTILGKSGSGKTCYLLAMYRQLRAGVEGYSVNAQDNTLNKELSDMFTKLKDGQAKDRFPQTTDYVETYSFNLNYANQKIESFDWIDYSGRITSDMTDENYDQVVQTIQKSSMLFICIDGELLRGNDTDKKIEDIREECAYDLNDFFAKYVEANNELPPTGIILTKSDLFSKETNDEEIRIILQTAFNTLFVAEKVSIGVMAVTLGEHIADNNYSGKVKVVNAHLPILMGIWAALLDSLAEYEAKINKLAKDNNSFEQMKSDKRSNIRQKEAQVSIKQSNLKTEQGRFFIFRSSKKINALQSDISSLKDDIRDAEDYIDYYKRKITENNAEAEKARAILTSLKDRHNTLKEYMDQIMWFVDGSWHLPVKDGVNK